MTLLQTLSLLSLKSEQTLSSSYLSHTRRTPSPLYSSIIVEIPSHFHISEKSVSSQPSSWSDKATSTSEILTDQSSTGGAYEFLLHPPLSDDTYSSW